MRKLATCMLILLAFMPIMLGLETSKPPACKGSARCFEGRIENVIDGDTLEISGETVRLSLVNTPEKTEPGFLASKLESESLCPVGSLAVVDEDDLQTSRSHRRIIGVVYCGNGTINLNEALLESGNGHILEGFCEKSEFSGEEWARRNGC